MRRGQLFIVSAPSGTGKTTLVERLEARATDLVRSCSYTSRAPRAGETEGLDYNFVSNDQFTSMVEADEFLEWAEIFGNRYGTSATDTERHRADGRDVVLVIDVQGARQVRAREVETVTIFVLPPSFEVLEQRLRARSSRDTTDAVARRLATARREVTEAPRYDYVVVNDEFERCVEQLHSIVEAERVRTRSVADEVRTILETFEVRDS